MGDVAEAAHMMQPKEDGSVFVFDNPRTRSHLFSRWLGTHPDLYQIYHPYLLAAHFGPENFYRDVRCSANRRKVIDELAPPVNVDDTYEHATRELLQAIKHAQREGKTFFVTEHCHRIMKHDVLFAAIRPDESPDLPLNTNPTRIPQHLLRAGTPIIIVRHPLRIIPSFYRTMASFKLSFEPTGEDMILQTSQAYARLIFDYLQTIHGTPPLIVDGDDIVTRTDELGTNLCNALGLDAAGLKNEWERTPLEQRPSNPYIWEFTKTMHESTGIKQDSAQKSESGINEAVGEWTREFGGNVAKQLQALVGHALVDYQYLAQFKL